MGTIKSFSEHTWEKESFSSMLQAQYADFTTYLINIAKKKMSLLDSLLKLVYDFWLGNCGGCTMGSKNLYLVFSN